VKRVRFRKLSRRYLDLEFSTADDVVVRIVERPGRWMSNADSTAMVEELRSIVRRALDGRDLSYGVFTGQREPLDNAVVTLVHDAPSGTPVAFNALSLLRVALRGRDVDVIHLGLAMVDPAFRGRGFSAVLYGLTCMLLLFRNQLRPIWMTNVSQVPSVIGLVNETFSNVFPSPDPRQRRSYDHLVIARSIMNHHRMVFGVSEDAGFDEQRFVVTNAYTGGSDHLKKSFAEAPPHRIEAYNQMCRQALDYDVGDDFLQVGQIDLAAARNFLLDHVPRAWLRSLVVPLAFLLTNATLLPVLHWLSPRQPMGDVRPRLPSPT
jgi:hypothetical protein